MKRRSTPNLALALAILTFSAAALPAATARAASFQENFDGVTPPALPTGWSGSAALNTWNTSTDTPDTTPNCAFAGALSAGGGSPFFGDQQLTSPPIAIAKSDATLSFRHKYLLGNAAARLEISIDGGNFVEITAAGGQFTAGGYTSGGPVNAPFQSEAWVGEKSSYYTTSVRLPAAAAGLVCQFRWRAADSVSSDVVIYWQVDSINLCDRNADDPPCAAPAGCGAGMCGAGVAPLMPLTVLALVRARRVRRRRPRASNA